VKRFFRPHWLLWGLLVVFLWWAWKDVAWAQVAALLQGLLGWRLLVWLVVNDVITLLFSLRWWLILAAMGQRVPYLKLAGYRLAGFAVSFFSPGPQFGGEPLQVYALTRQEHIPNDHALAAVVLDKLLELLGNFLFLATGIGIILGGGLLPLKALPGPGLALVLLALLPVGYLVLLWQGKRPLTVLLNAAARSRLTAHSDGISQHITRWVDTARRAEDLAADFCHCRPGLLAVIALQSLLVWGLVVFEYWLTMRLLGLWLPVRQVIFMLVAARLALLLPVPGGMGTLEASQVLAAQMLQINPAFAVSFTLLARARDFLLAGLGLAVAVALWREPVEAHSKNSWVPLRLGGLRRAKQILQPVVVQVEVEISSPPFPRGRQPETGSQ